MLTCHFYWLGAIPAMVFVGIFMMPFYYGSKARSRARVSQAALRREDPRLQRHLLRRDDRLLLGHLDVLLAKLLRADRWAGTYHFSLIVSAVIVLVYIFLGGLTSAIYNEVCSSS